MASPDIAMSPRSAQVSAIISAATKERLDRFTEELGLKKNFVERLDAAAAPTPALRELMRGRMHGKPTPMFLDIGSIAAALEG